MTERRDRIRVRERLFSYPEVLLPLFWPRWSRSAEIKSAFWEGFSLWRSGFLTDPETGAPYHDRPCLFRDIEARRKRWLSVHPSAPRLMLREPRSVADDPVVRRAQSLEQHRGSVRAMRERTPEEATPAMDKAKDQMEHQMAQFFLRNIGRMERETDEELPYERRETGVAGLDDRSLREARRQAAHYEAPSLLAEVSYVTVTREAAKARHLLFREPWNRLAGRELMADLRGPLWKYFPDDEAAQRYAGPNASRLDVQSGEEPDARAGVTGSEATAEDH